MSRTELSCAAEHAREVTLARPKAGVSVQVFEVPLARQAICANRLELPFDAADELAFDMIERSRSTPMSSMAVSYVLTRLETNV
ncbi:MAG: hypothetical protein AUH43_15705 [Acidobacteria bacterium 13_1_40CM_65_14]|nr:MAG: hypothetical protein AUH43_15705 [Acidobacteria bacterium 13_1_40CM_65_14]